MKNSTKTEPKVSPSVIPPSYDEIMKHIVDLSERINYIMEGMKTQAEMLKAHQDLLSRIKPRMGL